MKIHGIEVFEGFAFARWGDGEWQCILHPNEKKSNADKHHYFDTLSDALIDVLRAYPRYMVGILDLAKDTLGEEIEAFLRQHRIDDIEWVDAEVFHKSVYVGDWGFYHDLLSTRHAYVGPGYLRKVFKGSFVEVPTFDCWLDTYRILEEVRGIIREDEVDVIGFSGGMASKVWIDCLYKEGVRQALIDYGSVFDPLAGVKSRKYHKSKDYKLPKEGK